MHRPFLSLLLLVVLAGSLIALGEGRPFASETGIPAGSSYDQTSFAAELHRISEILKKKPSTNEMAALRDSLPKRWMVATPEGWFSISSETLRNQLTSLSSENARTWVNHLEEEVEWPAQNATHSTQARDELAHILARPEFGAVRPPSAWTFSGSAWHCGSSECC